jgi:hypothetical protein
MSNTHSIILLIEVGIIAFVALVHFMGIGR